MRAGRALGWDAEGPETPWGAWAAPQAGGAVWPVLTSRDPPAGVSAQSFHHCFTLASAAFNLQVATPGVSPATTPHLSFWGKARSGLLLLGHVVSLRLL